MSREVRPRQQSVCIPVCMPCSFPATFAPPTTTTTWGAGGLLEYGAVRQGLDSGHIAALGLDVHPQEPLDPQHWLAQHPR